MSGEEVGKKDCYGKDTDRSSRGVATGPVRPVRLGTMTIICELFRKAKKEAIDKTQREHLQNAHDDFLDSLINKVS